MGQKVFERKLVPSLLFPSFQLHIPLDLAGKNQHVESLRGVAIILVVLGHMIGQTSTGGMRVSDDSFLRYIYYSLEYIRLPLFTVISGWVYANKPIKTGNGRQFLGGKFRRLLIPMFVVGTLLFLSRMVIPGTNTTPAIGDLPRHLFLPYDVYWYLFSLFLIFALIALIDTQPFFHRLSGWLMTMVFALALLFVSENFLDPIPNVFSFKGAAYLLPYFLLGIGIHRYPDHLLKDTMALLALLYFVSAIVFQQVIWFAGMPPLEKHSVLGMAVGISASLLLFKIRVRSSKLVFIGAFAYSIFLFHVFFTGGSRIILTRLGIENQFIVLILGVVIAIFCSIALDLVLRRSSVLRYFLLGVRKGNQRRRPL